MARIFGEQRKEPDKIDIWTLLHFLIPLFLMVLLPSLIGIPGTILLVLVLIPVWEVFELLVLGRTYFGIKVSGTEPNCNIFIDIIVGYIAWIVGIIIITTPTYVNL